jgi:lysophospholipase L1-like esterase
MAKVDARWAGLYSVLVDDDGWQTFNRLDPADLLPPATDGLADRAAMPSGGRALWQSSGGTLTIEGEGSPDAAAYDILVNGERLHRLSAAGPHRYEVPLGELAAESAVELWLPHFGRLRILEASLEPAPEHGDTVPAVEAGPRWVAYGSSITQCQQADGPTETWPALVARAHGWHLSSLGFAGECQLDAAAARAIAATDADLISLCLGINSYNAATYSPRTYPGAVRQFLLEVRQAHPGTPIAVITPVLSVIREEEVNAVGWTLSDYRKATAQVVRALQDLGDNQLHLIDGAAVFSPAEAEARMPDTLHPDNAGYALMASRLGPALSALAPVAAPAAGRN